MAQVPHFAALSSAPGRGIAEAAARVGHYVWVSSRLFEVTGQWAVTSDDPHESICYAGLAGRFAWQADQWRDRLPRLREVDSPSLIVAPDAPSVAVFERLESTPRDDRASALLAVVDELGTVYRHHADAASPLCDGPVVRTLVRIQAEMPAITTAIRTDVSDISHTMSTQR